MGVHQTMATNLMLGFLVFALGSAISIEQPESEFLEQDIVLVETEAKTTSAMVAGFSKQFEDLQIQIKEEITPSVVKVINLMIQTVNKEIFPAIEQAHKIDQKSVDMQLKTVQVYNSDQTILQGNLVSQADLIKRDIELHNKANAKWAISAADYTSDCTNFKNEVSKKNDVCCDMQQSREEAIAFAPSSATCAYSESKPACVADAVAAVKAAVSVQFKEGASKFKALVGGCIDLKSSVKDLHKVEVKASGATCDKDESTVKAYEKAVNKLQGPFVARWTKTKGEYASKNAAFETEFNKLGSKVKAGSLDRRNEYESINQIKCMLKSYAAGGKFDSAVADKCGKETKEKIASKTLRGFNHLVIDYQSFPTKLEWVDPVFAKLDDYSASEAACAVPPPSDRKPECTLKVAPSAPVCK